jgi:hypothetical protein
VVVVGAEGVLDEGEERVGDLQLPHHDLHVLDAVGLQDAPHLRSGRLGRYEVLLVFAEKLDQLFLLEREPGLLEVLPKGVLYLGVLQHVPADVFHLDAFLGLFLSVDCVVGKDGRRHEEGWHKERRRRGEVEGQRRRRQHEGGR